MKGRNWKFAIKDFKAQNFMGSGNIYIMKIENGIPVTEEWKISHEY